MTLSLIVFAAALCLALGNGANDNFKGVATLFGSGTANYRRALLWATLTTFLGSIAAVFLATGLIQTFTGKGLVPAVLVTDPGYLGAVALGAAGTIVVATRLGMPVSTTHALVGGLIGPAWIVGGQINGSMLAWKFFGPLLISPLLAILLTVVLHRLFRRMRLKLGVVEQTCLCAGTELEPIAVAPSHSGEMALLEAQRVSASLGTQQTCLRRYGGNVAGIKASSLLDSLHYLSAGLVSFARGLNDTPKIAALMVAGAGLAGLEGGVSVALAMAVGGLLAARRVADTMSHKVTPMNAGQGFTANLVTGLIVIGASRLGVPVSTTHVSCGGIFGVGAVTSEARWPVIRRIVASWILTLPVSAVAAAALYLAISLL